MITDVVDNYEDINLNAVVEVLENLAFLANASNLVIYLKDHMNMLPSDSSNSVTNFMGTAFLLALLGGFLSDAFFTSYYIYLTSATIEFLVSLFFFLSFLFFFLIMRVCKALMNSVAPRLVQGSGWWNPEAKNMYI